MSNTKRTSVPLPRRPLGASEVLNPASGSCPVCKEGELRLRLLRSRRAGAVARMLQAFCQVCGSIGQHSLGS